MENIYKMCKDIDLHTPIEYLIEYAGSKIFLKRDDRINYSYGGNSVRIALEFFKDMYEKECDAIISYGSRHSNINRVISEFAKDLKIPCRVITSLTNEEFEQVMDTYLKQLIYGEENTKFYKHRNEELIDINGALRTYCKRSEVQHTIEEVMSQLKSKGKKAYYIYGDSGGSGYEEVALRAYDKAFDEIVEEEQKQGIQFDAIVSAYGIGMTLEGLVRGKKRHQHKALIGGISIARRVNEINHKEGYYITDKYLAGGYGENDEGVASLIVQMRNYYNIILDPIYTGKAFNALFSEIVQKRVSGNILFIHTGGRPVYDEWFKRKKIKEEERKKRGEINRRYGRY